MRKPDREERLDQELRFHVEEQARRHLADGLPEQEAWRRARAEFGGLEAIKEDCRDARRFGWLEDLGRDLRYGVRSLGRAPGFAAVAIATLALGIGANSAVFGLVHRVLIARLPVAQPERLVVVSRNDPAQNETPTFPQLFFRRLESESEIFDGVLARGGSERVTVGFAGGGEPAVGELVSGSYFEVLGVRPHAGRLLAKSDDVTPGAHPVVVLSHRYWLTRFGGDPAVVGRSLLLTGYPMTIIGVSPPGFEGLDPGQTVDLRLPLAMLAQVRRGPDAGRAASSPPRDAAEFNVVARLAQGANAELVQRRLTDALRSFRAEGLAGADARSPFAADERVGLRPAATGFGRTRQQFQATLWTLWAITGAVLVIACLNLANLLLARAGARRQEFAIRLSLGAGSGRLARQLLTEAVLLSLCGGAGGMLLAYAGSQGLARLVAGNGAAPALSASGPVLLFHWSIALGSGLLFGCAPAWAARRLDIVSRLKRVSGEARTGMAGKKLLCAAQVALSVVVLVGALLFLRTLESLKSIDPGFRADHLLVTALSPKNAGRSDDQMLPFFRAVRERVRAVPGVEAASYAMVRLVSGSSWMAPVVVAGSGAPARAARNVVGPAFFATLEIPLLAGRDFDESDGRLAPKVAIVSESFARFHFAGRDPIGQQIGSEAPDTTIVGVARDTKYAHLRETTARLWYVPYEQYPSAKYLDLYVRTSGSPDAAIAGVRSAIAAIDPGVALFNMRSQSDQIDEMLVTERMLASLGGGFGVLAAGLAALGLYGVLSLLVATRRREIGIRIALGARPAATAWQVARESWGMIGVGMVAGLLAAVALGRSVAALLHGVTPLDPPSLAGAVVAMAALATVAVTLPALRAARIDPLQVIREP